MHARSRRLAVTLTALSRLAILVVLSGCAADSMRNGIPTAGLAARATIANLPGVRIWGDEPPRLFTGGRMQSKMPNAGHLAVKRTSHGPTIDTLAISGGGADGAFGAGLLAGWSRSGIRPTFEVVTGVSAGAIIAPFAFLGPRYDVKLKEIWTQYQTSEIAIAQILPGLLGGPALADTAPLKALIAKYVDARMLAEIAAEYRKGRLLLIGTTNLDAQRPVIWNMGEIAASSCPEAVALFREVILASAAIPGLFPPVKIAVEADGEVYDELHVDGGTTRDVFVTPASTTFIHLDALYAEKPFRRVYVLQNSKIAPEQEIVKEQAVPIAARAISTLIKAQNLSDIDGIYRMTSEVGGEFNLTAVPATFRRNPKGLFDPEFQAALFETGYEIGLDGGHWMRAPPIGASSAASRAVAAR